MERAVEKITGQLIEQAVEQAVEDTIVIEKAMEKINEQVTRKVMEKVVEQTMKELLPKPYTISDYNRLIQELKSELRNLSLHGLNHNRAFNRMGRRMDDLRVLINTLISHRDRAVRIKFTQSAETRQPIRPPS
jgi:predicted RNase H-like nuclease (RuvC/YqgF family)